ncbi:sulfotransferase [Shinella sp. 838]|uniref:sulfotransferase n=1 Tax=Shinella sp. 838 TaxID=3038164 RepID=UPI0024159688|nr:sulfotransferase [Shinella sp. 838]MDG4675988.1 sulfotransferase [Shinella sp. 838]
MKLFRSLINKLSTPKIAGASNFPKKAPSKHDPYRYVFIFTYGRSGSTLLMGYLNSLPGFCIRGENYNALAHLCNFYRSAKETKGQVAKKSMLAVHPWYGADLIKPDEMRSTLRKIFVESILNPPADTKVVGCKEIRINWNEIKDFDAFLSDVTEVFGDVKIIFNHRDILATSKSSWWKDTAHSYATIRSMDQRLRDNAFAASPNAFHVEYEELVKGPEHARKLTEFLGVPFDPETYKKVMETRHSY